MAAKTILKDLARTGFAPPNVLRVCLGIAIVVVCICSVHNSARGQTDSRVVAKVNGREITQQELDDSIIAQLLPLQDQIYALRKAALENLITRAVLEDEAKKNGVPVDELKKQLTAGKFEVPAGQVDRSYSQHESTFGAMSPDEAKERLRLDFESQARMQSYRAAVSKLRQTAQIEFLLEEPKLPAINDLGAPAIGLKTAPVTIVEFSDFQCPFCRNIQSSIKKVLQKYPDQVRLVFKQRPLENHAQVFLSAQAAVCAGEQGLFWQYHDALFASEDLSPQALNQLASAMGLDTARFGACRQSESSSFPVLRDVDEAKRLGINGTPTLVINGRLLRGTPSFEEFQGVIERELKSAQKQSSPR